MGRKVLYEMDSVPLIEPIQLPTTPTKYSYVIQIESLEFQRTIAALQDTSDKGADEYILLKLLLFIFLWIEFSCNHWQQVVCHVLCHRAQRYSSSRISE